MMQARCRVSSVTVVAPNIIVLSFLSPQIASSVLPGQFVNVKVNDSLEPLLRRPFSVYRVDGERVEIIFNVVGPGTKILSEKHAGDDIDVLGPLGRSFTLEGEYETAVLVAGGLGVAPFPMVTSRLKDSTKCIVTFLGARTSNQLVPSHLRNVYCAADDGTAEFRGTVVDYLRSELHSGGLSRPKIFGCGPQPMLVALTQMAKEENLPCEVSLESVMGCGIGICQGCPVRLAGDGRKYALICKEGTVFDSQDINLNAW